MWIVIEYDRVNVSTIGETRYVPGEPNDAHLVGATTEEDAVLAVGKEGFFSAWDMDVWAIKSPREVRRRILDS